MLIENSSIQLNVILNLGLYGVRPIFICFTNLTSPQRMHPLQNFTRHISYVDQSR